MGVIYDFELYKQAKEAQMRRGNTIGPTETQEHIALMDWVNLHPVLKRLMIHIPNEGKRSPWLGAKLKRMGLRKGVSDFFLPFPRSKYHGLWIELKRDAKSAKTPEQIEWIDYMKALDYAAHFAYGFESAQSIILDYLKLEAPYI